MKRVSLTQNQSVILLILLAALFTLGAAIYSYSGPNRTVTIQDNSACVWEKSTCQWNERFDEYRWHVTGSASCSSESKPWLSGDDYHGVCNEGNAGRTQWNQHDNSTTETVTYPPATVGAASICVTPGLNGWCAGGGSLNITGSEPLAGQQIIAIEGTRNTVSIACVNAASCNVPLLEGTNNFTYWAVSSFGDTSLMGTTNGLKQDSLAPLISGPTLTGSLAASGWYSSAVTFNTTANDAVSGLTGLTCTLDGNASACTGVTVSGQGAHTLLAQASDAAGNSSQKTANFSIDTLPPTLDVQLSGTNGSHGWYRAAQVSATASDPTPGSGLAALEYSLDGGAWTSFAGSFSFPDGKHTLDVRAVDNAGNIKQAVQSVAWVDSVALEITLDTPSGTGGKNGWYVSATLVGAEADDDTSGIETFEYRLDNDPWTPYTTGLTLSDGVHSIVYYAEDTAGWVTQVVQSVRVDTHAPHISGSLAGTPGTNGWYISNATLTAAANDSTSGVATFTYTLDGGSATSYSTPLSLTDGIHTVLLYAEDQAGLTDTFSQTIKVDTVAPVLDVLTVLPEWVQDTVTLNGTASDTTSGLLKVEVSTDNGASWHTATGTTSWSYPWNTHSAADGAHNLRVRSVDYAGLSTQEASIAQVDNSAPVIALPGEWNIWDTVTFDAWDHESGLAGAEIVISDPQERWPKRRLTFQPGQLPLGLLWDRRFGDGTIAPFGDYDVNAWATNRLGINTHATATIHISFVGSLLPAPGTATPLPSPQASATPTRTSAPATLTPTPTGTVGPALLFGTPGSDATPTPTAEPLLRATPTAESFSSWLASIFVPPTADESTTDAGQGSDPQPSPAAGDPNVLYDAAAIAAVAGVTTYWAQKKKEEEEAEQAAQAQRAQAAAAAIAADPRAAEEAAARRRRTARARKMGPLEAAAEKLKEAIAAVTQKEQKEWKAERYEQISQTDEYKNSDNKTQFMKQELENIKEQEAAYREKEKKEAEAAAELPPPPPPLPPMPEGLSPEAQAAWLHSPAAAQWAANHAADLREWNAAQLAAQKGAQQATALGEQCELPDPQTVPPDFMRTLNYGKDFVQFLAPETRGFWYADASKPYDARMQVAIGYYYEVSQFDVNPDISSAVTEAFARKYYQETNQFGSENGLYRALGTLQSIRDRIDRIRRNPDDPENVLKGFELELGGYHNIDYAYQQAGRILNSPDPSWCNGILLDRPAAWGDAYHYDNNLQSILPEFMKTVTSENQGDKPNQIYRIQHEPIRDRYFFVMTQGQLNELCFGGSCVWPNPDYVNEQRRLRGK